MPDQALKYLPFLGADYAAHLCDPWMTGYPADPAAGRFHVLGESHYLGDYEDGAELTRTVVEQWAMEQSSGSRFWTNVLQVVTGKPAAELNRRAEWRDLAYSNFVQDPLGAPREPPTFAMWERGRAAFFDQLRITRPLILVVLGKRLWQQLPETGGERLPPLPHASGGGAVDDAWLYRYPVGGGTCRTIAVHVTHPAGRGFRWREAACRVEAALMAYSNVVERDYGYMLSEKQPAEILEGGTKGPPDLYYVPYETFLADLEAIARALEADSWRPDFLVGIGRGGLVPAAYLSHRTAITLLSVDHSSGDAAFADELLAKLAAKSRAGSNILIVDDINDSGATITHLRTVLAEHGCSEPNIRMAVLIDNIRSQARVEYAGTQMDRSVDKRWFVFPWEAVAPRAQLIGEAEEVPERLA